MDSDPIQTQLIDRGIADPRLIEAFRAIPRESFLPDEIKHFAWLDAPIGIGPQLALSQPDIVGKMTQLLGLTGTEKVLEIGTGTGYQAAILSRLARAVFSIEIDGNYTKVAHRRLRMLGITNVTLLVGDGCLGHEAEAPFDAIIVTAGAPNVPGKLLKQLAIGGRMVIPIGPLPDIQLLTRLVKSGEGEKDFDQESIDGVTFLPLLGEDGWTEELVAEAEKLLAEFQAKEAGVAAETEGAGVRTASTDS